MLSLMGQRQATNRPNIKSINQPLVVPFRAFWSSQWSQVKQLLACCHSSHSDCPTRLLVQEECKLSEISHKRKTCIAYVETNPGDLKFALIVVDLGQWPFKIEEHARVSTCGGSCHSKLSLLSLNNAQSSRRASLSGQLSLA